MSEFVNTQLRVDTSRFNGDDTYLSYVTKIDNLLGNPSTGVSTALQQFFSALQTASANPESLPARQAVLSQSDLLVGRFNTIYDTLDSLNSAVNIQLTDATDQISQLAEGIAQLNEVISASNAGDTSHLPNDLLDKRDELLRQLSELVDIKTVNQDSSTVNVFFSNGQALVVGSVANKVSVQPGTAVLSHSDVVLSVAGVNRIFTDEITGGKLGGALDFRNQALDPAFNQLGVTSLMISDVVNKQHALGMDLNNQLGGLFFSDINNSIAAHGRAIGDKDNVGSGSLYVNINDIANITSDDYTINFLGTNAYQIINNTTGANIGGGALSGTLPQTVSINGLDIVFESGSFSAGDSFNILPTRYAARDIDLKLQDVRDLALAAPIRSQANLANRGTGIISQGTMLDTSTADFAVAAQLSPPITIVFTSATTYDVLDNSDPSNPINLIPPLVNQQFVPGVSKNVFTTDSGQTGTTSDGIAAGVVQNSAVVNGYPAESFTFFVTDSVTGAVSTYVVNSALNDSAQTIASILATVPGVTATARTYAQVTNITNGSALSVSINGQALVGVTADTLASSINGNTFLKAQGIRATSDGTTVTLQSSTGVDFVIATGGGAGDSVDVVDASGTSVTVAATNPTPSATVGGLVDVLMAQGVVANTTGNGVFTTNPPATSTYRGYQVTLDGIPQSGDRFTVNYNTNGVSDNRNAVLLAQLETATVTNGGRGTISDTMASLIEFIGTKTNEAKINAQSSDQLLEEAKTNREAISGVNLDEEAARLLQFQQAYTAAARLITVGQQIFDTLLAATGR
jgi:flagellar hook-associated protein 1 FlgK